MDKVRSEFERGNTFGPNSDGICAADIHVGGWGGRIVAYGHSEADAEKLRDEVLTALSSREGEAVALVEDLSGTASEPNQFSILWLDKSKCAAGVRLYAAPSARVAELEAECDCGPMEYCDVCFEAAEREDMARRIAALESQLAASREREDALHTAICQAVAILNQLPLQQEALQANNILRIALTEYALAADKENSHE